MPFIRTGKSALLIGSAATFICCCASASSAEPKAVSTYYPAFGHAIDAAVAKTGDVLVALGEGSSPPGIQIFNPGTGYSNPCGGSTIINFAALGASTVEGIQLFPDGARSVGANKQGIGAAVEHRGSEFLLGNLRNCSISGEVHVQQFPMTDPPKPQHGSPGTFSLTLTPTEEPYAFLANEYGSATSSRDFNLNQTGTVGVVKTVRDDAGRFKPATMQVGPYGHIYVPGANTIPGVTVSNDGKYLYVANEATHADYYPPDSRYPGMPYHNPTGVVDPRQSSQTCLNKYGMSDTPTRNGVLTVIDVDRAAKGLGQASIVQTVAAGCSPVRIVESSDGKFLFVATRGGNPGEEGSNPPPGSVGRVLVFNVEKLVATHVSKVNKALVNVFDSGGTQPVGMALFDEGRRLAVANSNRYTTGGGQTSVGLFKVRRPIKTNAPEAVCPSSNLYDFPRGVASNGNTVYVANTGNTDPLVMGSLQVIEVNPGDKVGCTVVTSAMGGAE
jgi:hypothetical protein